MGGCLGKEHEIGWEVEFDCAGITPKELMDAYHEPDQKKMNEVWRRVGMKGMHGMKQIEGSIDGILGGKGTVYESYDKKGVMQMRERVIHYEVQDGGKSIYTETVYIDKGPKFSFKLRDQDVCRMKITDLGNGNVTVFMENIMVFEGRGFCGCMMKLMYPMVKFQQAIQDVLAPEADPSTVLEGKMTMKKELTYKMSRQVRGLLTAENNNQAQEEEIGIKISDNMV